MSEQLTNFWVSKYALTEGVQLVACEVAGAYAYSCGPYRLQYQIGRDCFVTEGDAIDRAENMRVAKIVSLRKQIARLEGMRFNP